MDKKVILVTGASRGAGKGIALALADENTIVCISARTAQVSAGQPLPGSLNETEAEIRARGAEVASFVVDHQDDAQVQAMFSQIKAKFGRLDIMVNNACAIPDGLIDDEPFWKKDLNQLDILNVGMRSHYVTSYYAAKMMVEQQSGLIVHTSSAGARCYMHGPAYGAGKAGVDKMAYDMAVDLKPFGVACVSLWMGLLSTERTLALIEKEPEKYGGMEAMCESPEFAGRVIKALFADSKLMDKSGQILVSAELAQAYGVTDINGSQPPSPTAMLGSPAQMNPAIVK